MKEPDNLIPSKQRPQSWQDIFLRSFFATCCALGIGAIFYAAIRDAL